MKLTSAGVPFVLAAFGGVNLVKRHFQGRIYAEAVLKFGKLNTQSQQRGAVVQGRSLSPYRLRYNGLHV
ncbi:MAG: hypothetical protein LBK06_01820 [Planctomycetaceae bacterium]|nr:hypothetical protein [Planctomycetaceae bacterium]